MIALTPEVVAALAHLPRCPPLLGGRCELCDDAHNFVAQARALVEPMKAAEPVAQEHARGSQRKERDDQHRLHSARTRARQETASR
jgi:hypothetical protein